MRIPHLFLAAAVVSLAAPLSAAERWAFHEKTLQNGLRIVVHEDHSCPIVAVQVWYHVGSKNEDPERQGFAHMFEHMMFRGTDRLGPEDHFKYIRGVGGNCNAYTSFDQTVYVQTLPKNQLDLVFWLEAERMSSLEIDEEGFATERKVVEEERRLGLNQPYGTVPEKILAQLFEKHPYRWMTIGKIEHLEAATAEELQRFWETYYVPNNAVLVVVGDVDADEVFGKAQRYFGWIPRCPEPPRVTEREPQWDAPKEIEITEERGPVPVAAVAWRTVPMAHEDALPLEMLAWILGGGESSRLWRRIVDDEGKAPMVMGAAFALEDEGFLGAGAMTMPFGDVDGVIDSIEAVVKDVREQGITDAELEKARTHFKRESVDGARTVESKAQLIGTAALFHGDPDWVNRRAERIERMTREELERVARTYLVESRRVTIRVKPSLGGMVKGLLGGMLGGKTAAENEPSAPDAGGGKEGSAVASSAGSPQRRGPKAEAKRPEGYPDEAPVAPPLDAPVAYDTVERRLANGLRVVVLENHELPEVSLRLGVRYGAYVEEKVGAASLAAATITKGTRGHTAREIAEELEGNAMSLGASAGMDAVVVSGSATSDRFLRLFRLFGECVLWPTFPGDEFAKVKQRTLVGMRVQEKQPTAVAEREFRRALYGEHFYGRSASGTSKDVAALEAADCARFWRSAVRPEAATLYVAGDVDPDAVFELADAVFGDWKLETPPPAVAVPKLPPPQETHILLVDVPGAVQSQIRAGHPAITRADPRWPVGRVLTQVFGGSFESRLNDVIRVKKGLTYGARGGLGAQRFAGRFYVSTFSKTKTTAEAVRAILDEVRRMREEPPSDHELTQAKSFLVGSWAGAHETPEAIVGELFQLELHGLPKDWTQRLLDGIRAATAEQVTELARDVIDPDHLVVVVVGDAAKVADGLREIAPVTVLDEEGRPKSEE